MNINDVKKKTIHLFAADPQIMQITAPWDAMLVPTEDWKALCAEVERLRVDLADERERVRMLTAFTTRVSLYKNVPEEVRDEARALLDGGKK